MDADAAVGKRIEDLRTRAGLSQEELSEMLRTAGLNWSQGTLSRVETGSRPMRFVEAISVARALTVDVLDLAPGGGGLSYTYQRRLQALQEHVSKYRETTRHLHAAKLDVQLIKFGLELSEGSQRPYVLHIYPEQYVHYLHFHGGMNSPQAALAVLGIDESVITESFRQAEDDLAGVDLDAPPPYAPFNFMTETHRVPTSRTPETHKPILNEEARSAVRDARVRELLFEGMAASIFRDAFPEVTYDVEKPRHSRFAWPLPVVEGIDTTEFDMFTPIGDLSDVG